MNIKSRDSERQRKVLFVFDHNLPLENYGKINIDCRDMAKVQFLRKGLVYGEKVAIKLHGSVGTHCSTKRQRNKNRNGAQKFFNVYLQYLLAACLFLYDSSPPE